MLNENEHGPSVKFNASETVGYWEFEYGVRARDDRGYRLNIVTTFARRPQKRSIALTALETRENVCSAMFTITASVYCSLEETLNPVCRGENCKL